MGKYNLLKSNFSSGELSPTLEGRSDIKEYTQGLAFYENFHTMKSGGAAKRQGSRYVSVLSNMIDPVLIPFEVPKSEIEILQSMVEIRPALVDVLDDFGYTPFLIACKAKESALSDEYPRLKFFMDSSLISLSEKYVFAIFLPSVDFQSVS